MRTSQFFFRKNFWIFFSITIALFSLAGFTSCKPGKSAKNPTCVKFTKAQIQKWVTSGFTDSTKKDYITAVQFRTAYAFPESIFKVYVIGQRQDGTFVNESLTELESIDTCKTVAKLSEFIFFGAIPATMSELGILDSKGQVNDSLQFLKLDPYDYKDPTSHYDYLAYNITSIIQVGKATMETTQKASIGLPCPPCPNCNKSSCPPPPTCEVCGPSITIDTIPNHP